MGYARLIWLDTTTARVPEEVVRPIRPRTLIALQNSSANIKKQTTLSSFSLPFLSFRLVSSFLLSTRTRPRRPVFKLVKKELETFGTHLPVLRSCMVLAVAWLARVRGFGVGDRLLTCGRGPGVRGGGQGTDREQVWGDSPPRRRPGAHYSSYFRSFSFLFSIPIPIPLIPVHTTAPLSSHKWIFF